MLLVFTRLMQIAPSLKALDTLNLCWVLKIDFAFVLNVNLELGTHTLDPLVRMHLTGASCETVFA